MLKTQLGKDPSINEIAAKVGYTPQEVEPIVYRMAEILQWRPPERDQKSSNSQIKKYIHEEVKITQTEIKNALDKMVKDLREDYITVEEDEFIRCVEEASLPDNTFQETFEKVDSIYSKEEQLQLINNLIKKEKIIQEEYHRIERKAKMRGEKIWGIGLPGLLVENIYDLLKERKKELEKK